jgi:hypothetical protein
MVAKRTLIVTVALLSCLFSLVGRTEADYRLSVEARVWNPVWDLQGKRYAGSRVGGPVVGLTWGPFSIAGSGAWGRFDESQGLASFQYKDFGGAIAYKVSSRAALFSSYRYSVLSGPNPILESTVEYQGLSVGLAIALQLRWTGLLLYGSGSLAPYTRVAAHDSTVAIVRYYSAEGGLLASYRTVTVKFGYGYAESFGTDKGELTDRRRGLLTSLTLTRHL